MSYITAALSSTTAPQGASGSRTSASLSSKSPWTSQLERLCGELREKDDYVRLVAARDLAQFVSAQVREYKSELFGLFMSDLNMQISNLVTSTNNHDVMGGIIAINELIEVDFRSHTVSLARLAEFLRVGLHSNDTAVLTLAAHALGRLSRLPITITSEMCVSELKRALECLAMKEKLDSRRHGAVLVLRAMAAEAPTLFYGQMSSFVDVVWVAMRDSRHVVRALASETLGIALRLIGERENAFQWNRYLFEETLVGFKSSSLDAHGSLLALGELLSNATDFMSGRTNEVCGILQRFIRENSSASSGTGGSSSGSGSVSATTSGSNKEKLPSWMKQTVISLLPKAAASNPDTFVDAFLQPFMDYLMAIITSPQSSIPSSTPFSSSTSVSSSPSPLSSTPMSPASVAPGSAASSILSSSISAAHNPLPFYHPSYNNSSASTSSPYYHGLYSNSAAAAAANAGASGVGSQSQTYSWSWNASSSSSYPSWSPFSSSHQSSSITAFGMMAPAGSAGQSSIPFSDASSALSSASSNQNANDPSSNQSSTFGSISSEFAAAIGGDKNASNFSFFFFPSDSSDRSLALFAVGELALALGHRRDAFRSYLGKVIKEIRDTLTNHSPLTPAKQRTSAAAVNDALACLTMLAQAMGPAIHQGTGMRELLDQIFSVKLSPQLIAALNALIDNIPTLVKDIQLRLVDKLSGVLKQKFRPNMTKSLNERSSSTASANISSSTSSSGILSKSKSSKILPKSSKIGKSDEGSDDKTTFGSSSSGAAAKDAAESGISASSNITAATASSASKESSSSAGFSSSAGNPNSSSSLPLDTDSSSMKSAGLGGSSSSSTAYTVLEEERTPELIALALNVLGSFNVFGYISNIDEFLRDIAVNFLEEDNATIRREAAVAVPRLLVRLCNSPKFQAAMNMTAAGVTSWGSSMSSSGSGSGAASGGGVGGGLASNVSNTPTNMGNTSSIPSQSGSNTVPGTSNPASGTNASSSTAGSGSAASASSTGSINQYHLHHSTATSLLSISEVIERLLLVGISDVDPAIRQTVLIHLEPTLDPFLASPENLRSLFIALNDEVFAIRATAIAIIGRLSLRNPSDVMPSLRRTLIQLLTELEFGGDSRLKEESAQLLSILIRNSRNLIEPYVMPILKALLPKLDPSQDPRLRQEILSAVGELAPAGQEQVATHMDTLIPMIITYLNDQSSTVKRELALRVLAQLARYTSHVVDPLTRWPDLLNLILTIAKTEKNKYARRQVLRVLGTLGALDPYSHKMTLQQMSASNVFEDDDDDEDADANKKAKAQQAQANQAQQANAAQAAHQGAAGAGAGGAAGAQGGGDANGANAAGAAGGAGGAAGQNAQGANAAKQANANANAIAAKSTTRKSKAIFNDPSIDGYYPYVAIKALTNILWDSSLGAYHEKVVKSIVMIVKDCIGESKVEPFLPVIMPPLLHLLRNAETAFSILLLKQIATIVTISKGVESSRDYITQIFYMVSDMWQHTAELLPSILSFIEEINAVMGDEFMVFLPFLIPKLLSVLDSDSPEMCTRILRTLEWVGSSLDDYLHLVAPAIMTLVNQSDSDLIKIAALHTIGRLCRVLNFSEYASRIVQPMARLLQTQNPSVDLKNAILSTLCHLIHQLGSDYAIFIPVMNRILNKRQITHATYEFLVSKVLKNQAILETELPTLPEPIILLSSSSIPSTSSKSSKKDKSSKKSSTSSAAAAAGITSLDIDETSSTHHHHHHLLLSARGDSSINYNTNSSTGGGVGSNNNTNPSSSSHSNPQNPLSASSDLRIINESNLKKAWAASSQSTRDDWDEWMRRFSVELVRESPQPALRYCLDLAQEYFPLVKDVFTAAFVSCWDALSRQSKTEFTDNLRTALKSPHMPREILQAWLNVAEFMEQSRMTFPIEIKELGRLAFKCHAFAKALHYKEMEFHANQTPEAVESLITLNTQLQQPEAAEGMLRYSQERMNLDLRESWYEKLHRWEEALQVHQSKRIKLFPNIINAPNQTSPTITPQQSPQVILASSSGKASSKEKHGEVVTSATSTNSNNEAAAAGSSHNSNSVSAAAATATTATTTTTTTTTTTASAAATTSTITTAASSKSGKSKKSSSDSLTTGVKLTLSSAGASGSGTASNISNSSSQATQQPSSSTNTTATSSSSSSTTTTTTTSNVFAATAWPVPSIALLNSQDASSTSSSIFNSSSISNNNNNNKDTLSINSSNLNQSVTSIGFPASNTNISHNQSSSSNNPDDPSSSNPSNLRSSVMIQPTTSSNNLTPQKKQEMWNSTIIGEMRCLHSLGEWDRLLSFSHEMWKPDYKLRSSIAPWAASAAWHLHDFGAMGQFIDELKDTNVESMIMRTVLWLHRANSPGELDQVRFLIEKTREAVDMEMIPLLAESYQRAYDTLVNVQLLSEMEEVIDYKLYPERRSVIRQVWRERLQKCQKSVSTWQRVLAVRAIAEMEESTWLKFALLCRKNGALRQSHKVLTILMGTDPARQPMAPLPTLRPAVTFQYILQLWTAGAKEIAYQHLVKFERYLEEIQRAVFVSSTGGGFGVAFSPYAASLSIAAASSGSPLGFSLDDQLGSSLAALGLHGWDYNIYAPLYSPQSSSGSSLSSNSASTTTTTTTTTTKTTTTTTSSGTSNLRMNESNSGNPANSSTTTTTTTTSSNTINGNPNNNNILSTTVPFRHYSGNISTARTNFGPNTVGGASTGGSGVIPQSAIKARGNSSASLNLLTSTVTNRLSSNQQHFASSRSNKHSSSQSASINTSHHQQNLSQVHHSDPNHALNSAAVGAGATSTAMNLTNAHLLPIAQANALLSISSTNGTGLQTITNVSGVGGGQHGMILNPNLASPFALSIAAATSNSNNPASRMISKNVVSQFYASHQYMTLASLQRCSKMQARCSLTLAQWQLDIHEHSLDSEKIDIIIRNLGKSLICDPTWHKAWHVWATTNFDISTIYEKRLARHSHKRKQATIQMNSLSNQYLSILNSPEYMQSEFNYSSNMQGTAVSSSSPSIPSSYHSKHRGSGSSPSSSSSPTGGQNLNQFSFNASIPSNPNFTSLPSPTTSNVYPFGSHTNMVGGTVQGTQGGAIQSSVITTGTGNTSSPATINYHPHHHHHHHHHHHYPLSSSISSPQIVSSHPNNSARESKESATLSSLADKVTFVQQQTASIQQTIDLDRERLFRHVEAAVKGFFRSIVLSHGTQTLEDTLRLLTLWFKYGGDRLIEPVLQEGFNSVPIDTWLPVIPQIIARMDSNNLNVRRMVSELLSRIGKEHPQALVYPLVLTHKSNNSTRQSMALSMMNQMRQYDQLHFRYSDSYGSGGYGDVASNLMYGGQRNINLNNGAAAVEKVNAILDYTTTSAMAIAGNQKAGMTIQGNQMYGAAVGAVGGGAIGTGNGAGAFGHLQTSTSNNLNAPNPSSDMSLSLHHRHPHSRGPVSRNHRNAYQHMMQDDEDDDINWAFSAGGGDEQIVLAQNSSVQASKIMNQQFGSNYGTLPSQTSSNQLMNRQVSHTYLQPPTHLGQWNPASTAAGGVNMKLVGGYGYGLKFQQQSNTMYGAGQQPMFGFGNQSRQQYNNHSYHQSSPYMSAEAPGYGVTPPQYGYGDDDETALAAGAHFYVAQKIGTNDADHHSSLSSVNGIPNPQYNYPNPYQYRYQVIQNNMPSMIMPSTYSSNRITNSNTTSSTATGSKVNGAAIGNRTTLPPSYAHVQAPSNPSYLPSHQMNIYMNVQQGMANAGGAAAPNQKLPHPTNMNLPPGVPHTNAAIHQANAAVVAQGVGIAAAGGAGVQGNSTTAAASSSHTFAHQHALHGSGFMSLIDQALLISEELIRVAISDTEAWHECLEEASRAYFVDHNPDAMIAIVKPLHESLLESTMNYSNMAFYHGGQGGGAFGFAGGTASNGIKTQGIFGAIGNPNLTANDPNNQWNHGFGLGGANGGAIGGLGGYVSQSSNGRFLTSMELSFRQSFSGPLNQAWGWCQKYVESGSTMCLNQAWDLYWYVYHAIQKQQEKLTMLAMSAVSPRLLALNQSHLAVPGTYTAGDSVVTIKSFHPVVTVIPSKQHPRKLRMTGSDGLNYSFLLKGHEDLRQDERVMQLFGLINNLLLSNPKTANKHLKIQRFAVIPLSPNSGLIGWVPHCDTMNLLIKEFRQTSEPKIAVDVESRYLAAHHPEYPQLMVVQKIEVFKQMMSRFDGKDLAKIMWLRSPSSEVWLDRRTNYIRSLAVMSMAGYILGLGDRHPSNIMIDRYSGHVVHIDFGDCFETAMLREKHPEKVPFRLTRMVINAMEVSGIEGTFRTTCNQVLEVLRENRDSLMAVLEAFIHDPLVNWGLKTNNNNNANQKENQKDAINADAQQNKQQQKGSNVPADAQQQQQKHPQQQHGYHHQGGQNAPTHQQQIRGDAYNSNYSFNNSSDGASSLSLFDNLSSTSSGFSATSHRFRDYSFPGGTGGDDSNDNNTSNQVNTGTTQVNFAAQQQSAANNIPTNAAGGAANILLQVPLSSAHLVRSSSGSQILPGQDGKFPPGVSAAAAAGNMVTGPHHPAFIGAHTSNPTAAAIIASAIAAAATAAMTHANDTSYGDLPFKEASGEKEINERALSVISRIHNKLTGRDFGDYKKNSTRVPLTVDQQVHKLILQATSTENLCQSFAGWCPWW